jgi:flavin reductase (DIM6/NTAB) family NADH-FMN oxidoreductase RutF
VCAEGTPKNPGEAPRELDEIPVDQWIARPCHLLDQQWLLLMAGDFRSGQYNCMTISWGSFGTMWNRPFAQVVVRPSRYTRVFMESHPTFTLCAFPERHRKALDLLGSRSGRDGNKIRESGLTPVPSTMVAAPCFAEAELVIECRKIYAQDLDPAGFLDRGIYDNYPKADYHRVYFGQIVAVLGTSSYRYTGRAGT